MTSHITVTTAANAAPLVKGFNAQADTAEAQSDVFAALLGANADATVPAKPATPSKSDLNLADLLKLALGNQPEDQPDQDPEAIAAAIAAVVPIENNTPKADPALTAVVDGLSALRTALQNGEVPSADDMAKLSKALDALAGALGVSLDSMPSADELAAMATQPLPTDADTGAQLQAALAPAAQDLLTGATSKLAATTDVSDQVKALGDKLAALLQGLKANDATADALTTDGAAADAALEATLAKLAKLAQPVPVTEVAIATQTFTAPKLDTSEPVLAGKAADTAASTSADAAAPDTADPVLKADTAAQSDSKDGSDTRDKPRDAKLDAVATAVAKTADANPPPQNFGPSGVHATTRIEATPGPRPVIPGYQTSQQQLNLPQIAFELVRQVNDGNSRFQMRLDPPELGKIDVRLDIDKSGQVTARLTVEKAETLDLMQRDQRGLEKALQQAGLDGSKTNLEFSLKQNPFGNQGHGQGQPGQPFFGGDLAAEVEDVPPPQVNLYRASLSASGVNIIA